jgi:opacity protein-like surface antigen
MKRLAFAAVLVLFVASMAMAADEFPKVEIFGGYSLMKLGGDDVNNLYEALDAVGAEVPSGFNFETSKWLKKGFDASATFNINKYFGIEANFGYNKGDIFTLTGTVEDFNIDASASGTSVSFMAGPRFAVRKNEKITPFAHFLFGMDRIKVEGSCTADGDDCLGESGLEEVVGGDSDTGFAFAAGGGFDLNVSKSVAIRAIQFDFVRANHDGFVMNNIKMSFGVVFKLGGK